MRILVATTHTIPAYSGGWTTPLDLFGDDHQAMYVIRNHRAGTRTIEGIKCVGVGTTGVLNTLWKRGDRHRFRLIQWLFRRTLKKHFKRFNADFVLCLDPEAGYSAMYSGLPYAMRFHSKLNPEHMGSNFGELMKNAVFAIAGPTTHVPDAEPLAHNQDLSRFRYVESPSAERALLLTSIDSIHEPELFIEGVMLSKTMRGDIVGTGEDRKKIVDLCKKTGGRVRCLPPVPRLKVPELLNNYQVGIATVQKISPVVYQMKVNAYMAAGLYTLAKPWTHIATEAPDIIGVFTTAQDMADHLDYLSENWSETLSVRRQARDWIQDNYSVEIPRKRFNEILSECFPEAVRSV
ncbi:MAG: hypothetical protein KAH31_12105 [Candidatus Sabulitectum sp.]|nr:hypothetical protein [Candidatus Sabulitectum sp.]